MNSKKLLSPLVAGVLAFSGLAAAAGGIFYGPDVVNTLSAWSKPASVQGQVITNGNLEVTSVGVVSIRPGAQEGVANWDGKPTAACEAPGQPSELGEVDTVITGSHDKSFSLSFPVTFVTVGDNLVAVGSVSGTVDKSGDQDLYEFSDWELVDNSGQPVREVKSGTYTVRANVSRNSSSDNTGSLVSKIGTSQDDTMTLNAVTVTIEQER